jgi:hypothetical protein
MNTTGSRILAGLLSIAALGSATGPVFAADEPAAPAATYAVPAGTPAYIRNAVESPDRSAEHKAGSNSHRGPGGRSDGDPGRVCSCAEMIDRSVDQSDVVVGPDCVRRSLFCRSPTRSCVTTAIFTGTL